MRWWIQTLEMLDDNDKPTGTWRLAAVSDERPPRMIPLCECEHRSMEGARDCETARKHATHYHTR